MNARAFVGVPTSTLVYVGPASREDFDRIALPETVYEWQPCKATTVLNDDGREWERQCRTKVLGEVGNGLTVIFQWFDGRPIETSRDAA